MFNPGEVLNAVQRKFIEDKQLSSLMGLPTGDTTQDKIERAKHIIKRSTWEDLITNEKRLCIYFRPSRRAGNRCFTEEVLQIDCHVPARQDYIAQQILAYVSKQLHENRIGNRIFEFEGQLGELPTLTGFYCAGMRFTFYSSK